MEAEKENHNRETSKGQRCYIPARYTLVAVLSIGYLLVVVLLSSLPIALTAMVRRRNTSHTTNDTDADTCSSGAVESKSSPNYAAKSQSGDFDWDEITQSYILTAAAYGTLASTIIGGRVAEMWNTKYTFIIYYSVPALVYMLLPVATDWGVAAVITFQVVSGAFAGPQQPVLIAMCGSWFVPQERQLLGAVLLSVISLGSIVAGLLTGNLVELVGWRFVFYLYSSLVAGMAIIFVFLVYDSPNNHPRISEEERTFINENIKTDKRQAAATLPWKGILLSSPVWAHLAMALQAAWVTATFSNSLPNYQKNVLNFSTSQIGNISAISGLAGCLSIVVFGVASQWVRKKKYLSKLMTYHIFNGISTLIPAIILVCIPFLGCNSMAIVCLLVLTTTLSGAYIGGSQLNEIDLSVNYIATLGGLAATLSSVVQIVAPTITGAMTNNKQTLAAWNRIFYLTAGVKVVPFFIFLFFGSVEEQPWNRIQQEETDNKELPVGNEVQSPEKTDNLQTVHTSV